MKIRYEGQSDDGLIRPNGGDSSLVLKKIYDVLEIFIEYNGQIFYRIISCIERDGFKNISLHSASLFSVVVEIIPPNWKTNVTLKYIKIGPERWQKSGFMESFYDGDPDAERIFKEEMDIILAENLKL